MAIRFVATLVASLLVALPFLASAQEWSLQGGAVLRGEYTDNYFLTPDNKQSALTTSVTPFVTASRRTETSDVAAVLGVGGNWVSGLSPTTDYVSGLIGLNGSLREARSTWTGNLDFVRSATLQNESQNASAVLGLAYTNAASVNGTYTYALTERWSLGAAASAYSNRYEAVASGSSFSDNHGYYAGGDAGYAFSDRTRFTAKAGYFYYSSGISHSDSAIATFSLVHQFSPELTISASAGGYWSDTTVDQGVLASSPRRATGGLYGGQIGYAFSENVRMGAIVSESLAPNANGVLGLDDNAEVWFSCKFSDRLTGRLGASYTRTTFPQLEGGAFNNNYSKGEIGLSYRLAERWTVDAGYRYARARYTQNSSEPISNTGFLSIAYNWPGASFTGWIGRSADTQGTPGAGPVAFPESSRAPPTTTERSSPQRSPFDPFTIP